MIHSLVFVALCIPLIYFYGLLGYGLAILGTVPVYYFIIQSIRKQSGNLLTDDIIISMICVCIALHWYYISYLALISLMGIALIPTLWSSYKDLWSEVKRSYKE